MSRHDLLHCRIIIVLFTGALLGTGTVNGQALPQSFAGTAMSMDRANRIAASAGYELIHARNCFDKPDACVRIAVRAKDGKAFVYQLDDMPCDSTSPACLGGFKVRSHLGVSKEGNRNESSTHARVAAGPAKDGASASAQAEAQAEATNEIIESLGDGNYDGMSKKFWIDLKSIQTWTNPSWIEPGSPKEPPPDPPGVPPCVFRDDPNPPAYSWGLEFASVAPDTTVRFHVPASPIALVVLFDGGGGSNIWFNQIEPRLLTEDLVDAGYAVLGLESQDTDLSDETNNFDRTDDITNVDIANLQAAISFLVSDGGLPVGLPLYYLGFSNGGAFASLATRHVPARAMALLNVRGDAATFDIDDGGAEPPPPTLWVIGQNDPKVQPDDEILAANVDNIEAAGVDYELHINWPSAPREVAFVRIASPSAQVSEADSITAYSELLNAGYLEPQSDDCSLFVFTDESSNIIDQTSAVITLGPTFAPDGFADEAKAQIDELYGAHQISSEFSGLIVSFFDSHL